MVALSGLLRSLLLLPVTLCAVIPPPPVAVHSPGGTGNPPPCLKQTTSPTITVNTPIGSAVGHVTNGVARFTVKYATAKRFQPATPLLSWSMLSDSNSLPPVCLQPSTTDGTATGVEDCLYIVFYVPLTNNLVSSGLPVLSWIHGGSFIIGSATNAGLDGSALAKATNSVVAVIQYRLGVLGFVPPSGASANSNLGAKDVVVALKFINNVVTSLGGNKALLTLAGQSSGATLIRGLLASPSASAYFQKAWLHSDPMAYGFTSPDALTNLQSAFFSNSGFSCGSSDLACQQAISTGNIINAQNSFFNEAASGAIDITVIGGEPIRIVHDGSFVTTTLTGSSFPKALKPIVVTTVNRDAGPAILGQNPDPVLGSDWNTIIMNNFPVNPDDILNSPNYPVPTDSVPDARPELITLGTDQIWRCPTWTLARTWASLGGVAYTGVINIGNVYVDNVGNPFCDESNVCHEGDIEILFGTISNPSPKQSAMTKEIQARYSSFIRTSNPNPSSGFTAWAPSTTGTVNAINLGGTGTAQDGGCAVGFFGAEIPYFYQLFGQ